MITNLLKPSRWKIIRWKYVVPRLLIVAVILASVRYGLDPLLKYGIVTVGQSATGAKVELTSIETSLLNGRVELKGLQVANPDSLMRNLMEAQNTQLQLDMRALFQKRIVVRNGEISGLAFDTERSESGELEIVVDETAGPSALDPLMAKASEWADDWLAEASDRLDSDFTEQLQTPQVARVLEERWKQQAANLRARAEELKTRGKQLEKEFRDVKSNPLRGVERLPALQTQLKSVRQELLTLQKEIKNLPEQVKADRNTLTAAKTADEAFIKQQLKFGRLDGENLTQVLLGKPVSENLQSSLEWIGWARKKIPTNSTKQITKLRSRGTAVRFTSGEPKFHVERLGLAINASLGSRQSEFIGSLTNLSTEPRLIAEPARLELIARGDVPVTLEVISDRRTDIAREELFLVCSAIPLEGKTVGNQEKLAIELAPGVATVRVELTLTDDELAGHVAFKQAKFAIAPLAGAKSNQTLVAAMTEALGNIDELSAEVKIAGTLERPEFKIESQLGQQIAEGIGTAVTDLATKKSESLLAGVSAKMNEQFANLESTKEKLQQELLAKLGENQQLVEGLAAFGGEGSPFSVPQLGSLGNGLMRK